MGALEGLYRSRIHTCLELCLELYPNSPKPSRSQVIWFLGSSKRLIERRFGDGPRILAMKALISVVRVHEVLRLCATCKRSCIKISNESIFEARAVPNDASVSSKDSKQRLQVASDVQILAGASARITAAVRSCSMMHRDTLGWQRRERSCRSVSFSSNWGTSFLQIPFMSLNADGLRSLSQEDPQETPYAIAKLTSTPNNFSRPR
ncbi:uncharacterized protein MYCFIDRAFT_208509 [Pseudocercospora fijiensis CIRAD86]|uniref:Uncharacterized protein n=1 Tax=Pseudocercospora fijiensis (strain CIRAD86) TaxID=383855 RepID=M3ASU5_PSEFD|nr:uncharacterized protein MYCFIDRAFT_208509 [Pseudocercospora fijiensis CIRAD86]EME80203.1 hypothetical protein MYCFIDRAFT_208509 [Pseudocercospora fijiensis CIRAD86]